MENSPLSVLTQEVYNEYIAQLLRTSTLSMGPPPTEEQKAEWAERRRKLDEYHALLEDTLDSNVDPMLEELIELHGNSAGYCDGCDFGGWEAERPFWPCRTAITIGQLLGVREPE